MYKLLAAIVLTSLFYSSCSKKIEAADTIANGVYYGTYQRIKSGTGKEVKVSVSFNEGAWSGLSDSTKYPALCRGVFSSVGIDSVRFTNDCIWTSDFDHTYILSGNYSVYSRANHITITRTYANNEQDVYELYKKM